MDWYVYLLLFLLGSGILAVILYYTVDSFRNLFKPSKTKINNEDNVYNVLWGLDNDNNVFYRPAQKGERWHIVDGRMKSISVGKDLVWAIDMDNNLYKCKRPCRGSWVLVPEKKFITIDAYENEVWGIDIDNNLFYKSSENVPWQQIRGLFKNIAVNGNNIWGIDNEGRLFKCAKPCTGDWQSDDILLKDIDINLTQIWGLDLQGKIYYKDLKEPSKWTNVPGEFKKITAGKDYIWTISNDNTIHSCKNPCTGVWEKRQGMLTEIDANKFY